MVRVRCKMLKQMMEKLQRRLSLSARGGVPEDVKEGYFAVHAVNGGKLQRFIVELSFLTHPDFLGLLEQAEEEFGFEQEGALVVPCPPDDLQRILEDQRKNKVSGGRTIARWQ